MHSTQPAQQHSLFNNPFQYSNQHNIYSHLNNYSDYSNYINSNQSEQIIQIPLQLEIKINHLPTRQLNYPLFNSPPYNYSYY